MADVKEQALQLLRDGVSPAEVARQLGISAATARTWKSRLNKPEKVKRNVSSVSKKVKRNATSETVDTLPILVEAVAENSKLSEAEKDFCLHYSYRPNASRAYRLAYPDNSPSTARQHGHQLMSKGYIRDEINRLNRIKREKMLETVAGDEAQVFQMMWDIAFSDMADFVEWGQYEMQVMAMYGPVFEKDEATGENVPVTKIVNDVRFVNSDAVDGTLVSEVKKGKDGASVKLADRMKALNWLTGYFELNPQDVHRREYDARRLELEAAKLAAAQEGGATEETPDDGFMGALQAQTGALWDTAADDANDEWVNTDEMGEG